MLPVARRCVSVLLGVIDTYVPPPPRFRETPGQAVRSLNREKPTPRTFFVLLIVRGSWVSHPLVQSFSWCFDLVFFLLGVVGWLCFACVKDKILKLKKKSAVGSERCLFCFPSTRKKCLDDFFILWIFIWFHASISFSICLFSPTFFFFSLDRVLIWALIALFV